MPSEARRRRGARDQEIERRDGDFARFYDKAARGQSSYFVWLNCGKKSVVLDIKEPNDRKLLGKLGEKADVFIQNLAPGAMARAEFDTGIIPSASGRRSRLSQVGRRSGSSLGAETAASDTFA